MSEKVPNSMIADAISTAVEIGAKQARAAFKPVHAHIADHEDHSEHLVQLSPDAPAEIREVTRPRDDLHLTLTTLKSLVDMLAAPHKALKDSGVPIVQVTPFSVTAQYNPDGYEECHSICMPLRETESFLALRRCFKPIKQEDFWKLLATDLFDCFPEVLEFQVAQLGHVEKRSNDVQIQRSGINNSTSKNAVTLHFSGNSGAQEAEVIIDWVYKGPLWTCFNVAIEVPCRLVITVQGTLFFELVPRGLNALILAHRAALSEHIADLLAARDSSIPVYEGEIEYEVVAK